MIDNVTYDAWMVTPPCELPAPYCNIDCPYFYQCYYTSELADFFYDTERDERIKPIQLTLNFRDE